MLEGTTYEIGVRGLPEECNCMRFVHPCLTAGEHEMPSEHDRRLDYFQESLRTEAGGRGTISSCVSPRGKEKRKRGKTNSRKRVHGITVGVQLEKLVLGPLGFPRRFVARKWGRLFGMDIIVAGAMDGILAVSPLYFPKRENLKQSARCSGKGEHKMDGWDGGNLRRSLTTG